MLGALHRLQRMPSDVARRCLWQAQHHPFARPTVDYPDWYLQRWHCLPEGYLSRRSAELYDQTFRRIYAGFRERAVFGAVRAALPGATDAAVLEIGCGTGRLLTALRSAMPRVSVAGADLSPFMVEAAARNSGLQIRTLHPGEVATEPAGIVHADARRLPWQDGQFDVVAASHLIGHVPMSAAAEIIAEAWRVLRPGGRIVVAEHRWHRLPLDGATVVGQGETAGGTVRFLTLQRG
ncbi:MAG: class I SAM-dependent methyltransferase [Dehalococcoidia bacterium]